MISAAASGGSQRVKCRRSAAREILRPPGYSWARRNHFPAEARAKPELAAKSGENCANRISLLGGRVQFPHFILLPAKIEGVASPPIDLRHRST